MSSTAVATMVKMMKSLPETAQNQVVDHFRESMTELRDEVRWDHLFQKTQSQLVVAARRAKQEKAQGLAKPMTPPQGAFLY